MYKLVIIDDEYDHVQGIRDYIPWSKYDVEVCGVAYNGKDGLELFESQEPDIALIDIKMPFIDGLSLIEEVKKLGHDVQMIIMSGYDNFEFARKAIQLQANNYLLKPCSAEEILQAVLRAKNIVDEKRRNKQLMSSYQPAFGEYMPFFRSKLLTDLLNQKLRNPESFYEDAAEYNIGLSDAPCCVAVFRLEESDGIYTRRSNKEFDYLYIRILEVIDSDKSKGDKYELFIKDNDFVLISCGGHLSSDHFEEFVNRVYNELSDTLECTFQVGIGKDAASPLQAHKSYRQALAALESSTCNGGSKVNVFNDKMTEESFHYLYPIQEENRILQSLGIKDISMLKESVDGFFKAFDGDCDKDVNFIKKVGVTLLYSIIRFYTEKNLDTKEIQEFILKSFNEVIEAKTFEALKEKMIRLADNILKRSSANAPVNKFIQRAIEYIHKNYSSDISLRTVADDLYISPAYLSFLFKHEMKTNFIDYLNNYRVLMAKELLSDIRLKNYEVAYKVGFQDEKYFFKIFKKYTGLTASQYRESLVSLIER